VGVASYWSKITVQQAYQQPTLTDYYQRLITYYGLNLYCAACRQLALLATNNTAYIPAIDQHTQLLLQGSVGLSGSIRAWSDDSGGWAYGDAPAVMNAANQDGYFFSFISDRYYLADPVTGATDYPKQWGGAKIHWTFYDPFLGENSWAALIAPLQAAFFKASHNLQTARTGGEVKLAKSVINACLAMQSPVGGVYARPTPKGKHPDRLVANETNLTLFAGLAMYRHLTQGHDDPQVEALYQGLLAYFRTYLFGEIAGQLRMHTCGTLMPSGFRAGVMVNGKAARFAVDVHTWGMSVLGVAEIDNRYGQGTCYRLWQQVKAQAGFYDNGLLAGVGYSPSPNGEPVHDVCSPEWTFGAINMCRILANEYSMDGPNYAPELAEKFREDEGSMLASMYRFEAPSTAGTDYRSYQYVNQTYDTGFGWMAFPIESLCATAWAIMIRQGFNPFCLGGACVSTMHQANTTNYDKP